MLRFFRQIRQKLIKNGNIRKYFWYALGEILLVMIGILLALQINNWNEERKKRNTEIKYLQRLLVEVERDSLNLQSSIELVEYKVDQAERLLEVLTNNQPVSDSANFVRDVFLIGRGGSYRPYLPSYEEMISTGELAIIQNDTITDYISRYINRIQGWESFVYQDGERRRSEYMQYIHHYFSAMIMDYIWGVRRGEVEFSSMKPLGINIKDYRRDPASVYHIQSVGALNQELFLLYNQIMNIYTIPILEVIRDELNSRGE
ncbi:MAG TPA: hypothetical protein DCL80_10045 [Balneola sp.]|jgi:hypothetical protein|nr:hypothetical protein [Balneola sp.]MAO76279.1 hypothetical protein [Balneola sp.]MBF65470.1 hypothetical protein [Balneola sp.]HAH51572.1 hypothetical protein [Balneola sp.]HBZ40040.1 hypothetical protein [Balneola sp.]|tara:strand:- start:210 stop:989 length:780 start_codon:yes stop_codon:yes gene_type:complete